MSIAPGRCHFWDVVRGTLMLIVVFAHGIQRCNGGRADNPLHLVIQCFQMEALMVVSGYVAAYSTKFSPLPYVKGKVRRLLVPYLLWVLPMLLCLIVAGKADFSISRLIHDLMYSNFWFLRTLFLIFMAFVGYRALERFSVAPALVLFFLLLSALSWIPGQRLTLHYGLYFIAGYVVHKMIPFEVTLGGPRWLSWIGRNSLAVYAVHWNLLFAYFPYKQLHLTCVWDSGINIYVRAFVLSFIWILVTVGIILVSNRMQALVRGGEFVKNTR